MAKLKNKYIVTYEKTTCIEGLVISVTKHQAETWAVSEAQAHNNLYHRGLLYEEHEGYGGYNTFTSIVNTEVKNS